VNLVVTKMGEESREDGRLRYVLARMSSVAVLAGFGVARLSRRALVRAAACAEDAIRDVMRAMVTPHGA